MLSGLFKAISMAALSLSLVLPNISFAGSASASNQATATLSSSCTITAQNLNFGSLVLPLSAQSASTSMAVLCSKNHAYTIGLAYGGVYGTPNPGSNYWYVQQAYGTSGAAALCGSSNYTSWYEMTPTGGFITSKCVASKTTLPATGLTDVNGTYYTGAVPSSYNYGEMMGVAKGDKIAYSIQVPGNPGQIWNAGNSSYSSTGTGATQSIPVVGTLVPSQSGSTYPTPDSYMDTVTATVNF